jgi:hypothetical protein
MPSLLQPKALGVHPLIEEVACCKGKQRKHQNRIINSNDNQFAKSFKWVYKTHTENIIWKFDLTHLNVDTSKNQVDIKGISFKTKQTGLKWQRKSILIL